jgi:hypothetical protein
MDKEGQTVVGVIKKPEVNSAKHFKQIPKQLIEMQAGEMYFWPEESTR